MQGRPDGEPAVTAGPVELEALIESVASRRCPRCGAIGWLYLNEADRRHMNDSRFSKAPRKKQSEDGVALDGQGNKIIYCEDCGFEGTEDQLV